MTDLKPEDRALIEPCPHCGCKVILTANGKDDGLLAFVCEDASPCRESGLMTCCAVEDRETAISAWSTRAPGGGGDALVATIETALRNSLHWQNPDAVDKADHAIHLSGGVTPASSGCTLDLRDIAQSIAEAIPTRDEAALPEAKPVAFYNPEHWKRVGPGRGENCSTIYPVPAGTYRTPLYAAPPPPVTEVAGDVVRLVEAAFDSRNVGLNGTDYALGWDDAVRNCRADILAILADRVPSEAEEGW